MKDKIIRMRINKGIDNATEKKILKLKGHLIANSFTDIIHIEWEDDEHYVNSFTTDSAEKYEAIAFIDNFIQQEGIKDYLSVLS